MMTRKATVGPLGLGFRFTGNSWGVGLFVHRFPWSNTGRGFMRWVFTLRLGPFHFWAHRR